MTERRLGNRGLGTRVVPDRIHAFVATPAYDGKVDTNYSQSLAEAAFCAPLHQVYLTAAVMGNGAFIDLARNIFVKMFLEQNKDASHLFFIDSDLKFEARAFIGLLKSGLPICAGAYRRRQEPEDYPVRYVEHPDIGGLWVDEGFLMCDRVATGFLCISRQVIEEMAADAPKLKIQGQNGPVPQLFYTKVDENGSFVGEDFAFCDDYVRKYGRNIPVYMDLDFVHGGYPCNYHAFLAKQIEAQKPMKEAA